MTHSREFFKRWSSARSAALVGVGAAFLLAGCTPWQPAPEAASPTVEQVDEAPESASSGIPAIVDAVQPSVVTIFTGTGLGSGVIYSEEGVIITNEHVIRGNVNVEIAFADGQRVAGRVTAADRISDLALVQADRGDLPAAEFQTELPDIGELAIVIGSPLGFESTVTAGIISGLHREIPGSASTSQSLVDLIQTDAPISPGNSGGAVVNGRGQIIGISEAYIPPSAGAVALGFAIPAATATEVAEELLDDGTADHSYVGIVPGAITQEIAEQLRLDDTTGVAVLSVAEGGPAERAGIRPGDILVSMDGEQLRSPEDLLAALRQLDPGDEITLDVQRDGRSETVDVTLTDRPTE
jgi:serine protease DegQ